jgi:ribosomal RNA-processing protein 12
LKETRVTSIDDFATAVANIDEFITMMAGGLAGASPHMISASITAISRLLFEFKGSSL